MQTQAPPQKAKSIAILGGGLAGLAAAYRLCQLERAAGRAPKVTLFEAQDRLGGIVKSEERADYTLDLGPDGFLTKKKQIGALIAELGLSSRLVPTQPHGGASIVCGGRLIPIPAGFSLMAPTRVRPFLASPLLSRQGKARALAEVVVPKGPPLADESLGAFVRRRFGPELLEKLVQPLASGIYGANPDKLSLAATFPRFRDYELSHGSVILGAREAMAGQKKVSGARYSLFSSFKGGLGELTGALAARLPEDCVRLQTPVLAIGADPAGCFELDLGGNRRERFDGVISALPASRSAKLLRHELSALEPLVAGLGFGSTAVVILALPAKEVQSRLRGFGFVCPTAEDRPAMAATYLSRKWPGRSPQAEGLELVRVFLRPGRGLSLSDPDERLVQLARGELEELLGIFAEPAYTIVSRYPRALPQYPVGHLAHVEALEGELSARKGLEVCGNYLRGVGIPDAADAGQGSAKRLFAKLYTDPQPL